MDEKVVGVDHAPGPDTTVYWCLCLFCNGTGQHPFFFGTCDLCGGSGKIFAVDPFGPKPDSANGDNNV